MKKAVRAPTGSSAPHRAANRARSVSIDAAAEHYGWAEGSPQRVLLERADRATGKESGLVSAAAIERYLNNPEDLFLVRSKNLNTLRRKTEETRGVSSFEAGWERSLAKLAAGKSGPDSVTPAEMDRFLGRIMRPNFDGMQTPDGSQPVWITDQQAATITAAVAKLTGEKHVLNPEGGFVQEPSLYKNYMHVQPNGETRIPAWVAHVVSAHDMELIDESAGLVPPVERSSSFTQDPDYSVTGTEADYRNTKYDNGHVKPAVDSANQESSRESNFYTNIGPHDRPLNRGMWMVAERASNQLARASGDIAALYAGHLFLDEQGRLASPSEYIGKNRVAVPTHLFKTGLFQMGPRKPPQAFAFLVPNEDPKVRKWNDVSRLLASHRTSVDHLEKLTGLNFFPHLPAAVARKIESKPLPIIDIADGEASKVADLIFGDGALAA